MADINVGDRAQLQFTVTDADTAIALGSGDVHVLATPRLIAWAEATTVAAVVAALDPSETTVGMRVCVDHLAATAVGETVTATAEVIEVDRRRIEFAVDATDSDGTQALKGTITRLRVDRGRFHKR